LVKRAKAGRCNRENTVKRQRPKKAGPPMVVGIAWYREADWARIKDVFPDAADPCGVASGWAGFCGTTTETPRELATPIPMRLVA
jgi:hypothetical protein